MVRPGKGRRITVMLTTQVFDVETIRCELDCILHEKDYGSDFSCRGYNPEQSFSPERFSPIPNKSRTEAWYVPFMKTITVEAFG